MPPITQTIEKLQKKLEKDPRSYVFSQLAEEHRKEGNLDEALRILQDGLAKHPNYWSARVTLARVYHQIGNTAGAKEELEKVVQAAPDNLLANRLLGDIYTTMELSEQALQRYRIVQMLTPGDQELKILIKRLESEVAESQTAVSVPSVPVEPEASAFQEAPAVPDENGKDAETEVYAPTVQIQVPEILEKTEVPVEAPPAVHSGEAMGTDTQPALVAVEEPLQDAESGIPTIILKPDSEAAPRESTIEGEGKSHEAESAAEELSKLAGLLLTEESQADDRRPTQQEPLEEPEFMELEEDAESEDFLYHAQQDHTQPIEESEEEAIEDAAELTSETLADLYLNQGFIDKAVKVYQRLLMDDPGNEEILRKLQSVSPAGAGEVEFDSQEKELLLIESEQSPESAVVVTDSGAERDLLRRKKIQTLESWLSTIRREKQ